MRNKYVIGPNVKDGASKMVLHLVSSRIFPSSLHYGFIEKPKDSRTDKNSWRAFKGTGFATQFIGHFPTKAAAAKAVYENRNGQ